MKKFKDTFKQISALDVKALPKEYARKVLEIICHNYDFKCGSIFILNQPCYGLIFSSYNTPSEYPEILKTVNAQGISEPFEKCIRDGKCLFIGDCSSEPLLDPWRSIIDKFSVKTLFCVPLVNKSEVFGTLNLHDTKTRTISEDEIENFEYISILLSHVISSNEYVNEINRQNEKLENEINERKNVEKRLAEQLNFLEVLIDVIPNPFFYKDASGVYKGCNKCFELYTGLKKKDVIGKTAHDIYPKELADKYVEMDNALMRNRGTQVYEYLYSDGEGTLKSGIYNKAVFSDATGNISGIVTVGVDITEQKKLEDELKKARDSAESANRAKSMFLASMSHEIRTPLNSIIGFSEMLTSADLSREEKNFLNYIRVNGRHLLSLIDNILDFSKIEEGKLELDVIPFKLEKVIDDVICVTKINAIEKNVKFERIEGSQYNDVLMGDPSRLRQILINLMTNAIKFTRDSVSLGVDIEDETSDSVRIKFAVADNGIGIAKNNIDKVFSPFVQADSSISRYYGGSGLGLAISNKLVSLMSGNKINIESSIDVGSIFYFTAEFKKAEVKNTGALKNETVSDAPDAMKKSFKVLLVEDNFFNVQLVQKFLESIGHTVDSADSGKKALEMITCRKYDVVIMDIQMPEMDGIEATSLIRKSGITVPIIAITADATQKNYRRCIDVGMTGYITKPINIDELEAAILNSVEGKSAFFKLGEIVNEPEVQIFNFEKLNNNFTGVTGSMEKFVKLFFSNRRQYIDEITAAVAGADPEKLKFTAHKIKGTALNACAERIAAIFKSLEACAEEAGGFEKARVLINGLPDEFELYRQRAREHFFNV